jgi:hypothetical protein
MVIALAFAAVALAAGPASGAAPSLLTKGQVRKAMLTLPAITTVSRVGYPVTANGLVCHNAPYLKATVNYCYYEFLHSEAAFAAGKPWPNHVDVLTFVSPQAARHYIGEMKASRPPTAILSQTPLSVVFFDAKASISTSLDAAGQLVLADGGMVSVFSARGSDVVYTACADPTAVQGADLASCANALAKAQLARLP